MYVSCSSKPSEHVLKGIVGEEFRFPLIPLLALVRILTHSHNSLFFFFIFTLFKNVNILQQNINILLQADDILLQDVGFFRQNAVVFRLFPLRFLQRDVLIG